MNKITEIQNNIMNEMNHFLSNIPLENLITQYNQKAKTISISGDLNNIHYSTTLTAITNGIVQTSSQINAVAGRSILIQQAKELHNLGYNQTTIAKQLGVSQATISNYLRKL